MILVRYVLLFAIFLPKENEIPKLFVTLAGICRISLNKGSLGN